MDIHHFDLMELSINEQLTIEGGILPLIIVGAAALLVSGCQSNEASGKHNIQINCTNCNVVVNGDTVKVYPKK